jgi:hypothetical protein
MQGKYGDGKTIDVVAPAGGVLAGHLYRISGWNGLAEIAAAAGETFPLNIDPAFMFYIPMPADVAGALGAVLYMPTASGGVGDTDLTATSTSNVAAVKVTQAKDASNVVGVRVLNVS